MTPRFPDTVLDLPDIATDSVVAVEPAGEVYGLSTGPPPRGCSGTDRRWSP